MPVERFEAENLVRVEGKNVKAITYGEFVESLYERKELPQREDHWRKATGKRPPSRANQLPEAFTYRRRLGSWLNKTPIAQATPCPECIRCKRFADDSWWKCAQFCTEIEASREPSTQYTATNGSDIRGSGPATAAKLPQAGDNDRIMRNSVTTY